MPFNCPHCKAKCQFDSVAVDNKCSIDGKYQAPWVCQNCGGFIITKRPYTSDWSEIQFFPLVKINPNIKIDKLPENIRNDYLESLEDYSNGCYTSAIIMCRRVIQQSCLDKKVKKQNLYEQIEELSIDENLKQLAHKLRFWGNKGAHPDILLGEKIEERDAKLAINFAEKFLEYIYIIPKEIEEIEGEVKEKKNKKTGEK